MTPKTDIQFYDTPQLAAGRFINGKVMLKVPLNGGKVLDRVSQTKGFSAHLPLYYSIRIAQFSFTSVLW
jgi:hypothetical protein